MDSGGIVLEWFRNYLTNSKQIVNYRSVKSKSSIITCGVPQGSILGRLLFLIYVYDISESSNLLSFLLFSDDTNLFINISINIGNQNMEQVNSKNFLGLNIDRDLSWKHHH